MMLSPKLEARMLQELTLKDSHRVLEIGTGSGYMTALLARMAGHVYSVELRQDFSAAAAAKLARVACKTSRSRSGTRLKAGLGMPPTMRSC